MKNWMIFLVAVVLMGCNRLDIDKDVPRCIKRHIQNHNINSTTYMEVSEYTFNGATIYLLVRNGCFSYDAWLYDDDCNQLNEVIGHLDGQLYINGVDFFQNADFVKIIYPENQ